MLDMHDLNKLIARGFRIKDETCRGELDGVSAYLNISDSVRIQVYQGCQGVYELHGQGRGRQKKHVLVKREWFTPSWYIAELKEGDWVEVTMGSSASVDEAVEAVHAQTRELYPAAIRESI